MLEPFSPYVSCTHWESISSSPGHYIDKKNASCFFKVIKMMLFSTQDISDVNVFFKYFMKNLLQSEAFLEKILKEDIKEIAKSRFVVLPTTTVSCYTFHV